MKKLLAFVLLLCWSVHAFAAHAFVQDKNLTPGNYVSAQTLAFTSNVTAGHTLIIAYQGRFGGTMTPTDGQGDTFVAMSPVATDGSNSTVEGWYVASAIGGATTVTFTPGGSPNNFSRGYISEYSGVGSFIGSNGQWQNGVSVGANGVFPGTVNVTSAPALVWGYAVSFSETATAGTSPITFTSRTGDAAGVPEDGTASSTGNTQPTWGDTTGGQFFSVGAAFADAAGSTCTHAGWNLATGAFSVPTAGSGTFWLQSGAGGSTDCSATTYWQSGGVFGAN